MRLNRTAVAFLAGAAMLYAFLLYSQFAGDLTPDLPVSPRPLMYVKYLIILIIIIIIIIIMIVVIIEYFGIPSASSTGPIARFDESN